MFVDGLIFRWRAVGEFMHYALCCEDIRPQSFLSIECVNAWQPAGLPCIELETVNACCLPQVLESLSPPSDSLWVGKVNDSCR